MRKTQITDVRKKPGGDNGAMAEGWTGGAWGARYGTMGLREGIGSQAAGVKGMAQMKISIVEAREMKNEHS